MDVWALPGMDEETCDGCGSSVGACHGSVLFIAGGKAAATRPEARDDCTDCEPACPVEAIRCPFEIVWA